MLYVLIGLFCLLIALLARRRDQLGPALCLYCGLSILLYGITVANGSPLSPMGSIIAFVQFAPDPLGPETATALSMAACCIAALLSSRKDLFASESLSEAPEWLSWAVVALAAAALAVAIASIGVESLWASYGYGQIKTSRGLYETPVVLVIASLSRLLSVAACILFATRVTLRPSLFVLVSGVVVMWSLLLAIAQSSRVSAVFPAVIAFCALQRKQRLFAAACILFGVLCALVSLEARKHNEQGLAYVFDYAALAFDRDGAFADVFLSMFGAMSATSATAKAANPDAYDISYKLLSFSPGIDLIDGFRSVKEQYEQRMAVHIPFNAYGEAYSFGISYFVLFWLIIISAAVSSQIARSKGIILYWCCVGLFLQGLIFASQYPIRNCIRYFYLAILVSALANALTRGNRSKGHIAVSPFAHKRWAR